MGLTQDPHVNINPAAFQSMASLQQIQSHLIQMQQQPSASPTSSGIAQAPTLSHIHSQLQVV
jgi:hypothetical protein